MKYLLEAAGAEAREFPDLPPAVEAYNDIAIKEAAEQPDWLRVVYVDADGKRETLYSCKKAGIELPA